MIVLESIDDRQLQGGARKEKADHRSPAIQLTGSIALSLTQQQFFLLEYHSNTRTQEPSTKQHTENTRHTHHGKLLQRPIRHHHLHREEQVYKHHLKHNNRQQDIQNAYQGKHSNSNQQDKHSRRKERSQNSSSKSSRGKYPLNTIQRRRNYYRYPYHCLVPFY